MCKFDVSARQAGHNRHQGQPPVATNNILLQGKLARWGRLPSQPSERSSPGPQSRGRASRPQPAPSCRRPWLERCEPSAVPWRQLLQLYQKRCRCTVTRASVGALLDAVTARSVCRSCREFCHTTTPHDSDLNDQTQGVHTYRITAWPMRSYSGCWGGHAQMTMPAACWLRAALP